MELDWQPLADTLAATLETAGVLREPVWRQAFAETPRHLFVPCFLEQRDGADRVADGTDSALRSHWLAQVYSDTNLITQVRATGPEGGGRRPTSSSSMPSIMGWMLEALTLAEGHRVLEIGTGTGYNAALLCHRLGDANVASIDIDPALVDQVRVRLRELGYAPLLVAGDGVDGVPAGAPYDAILATAAVDHIPPAWIEQLRPGGVIVTDLRGGFSGAIVRLRKIDDGTVEGRCDSYDAAFMPLRSQLSYPLRQGAANPLVMDRRNPQRGTTMTDPRLITESRGLRFIVELQLGGRYADLFANDNEVVVSTSDGSWATAELVAGDDGTHTVAQGGQRRLWDSVEAAVTAWQRLGKPPIDAFGVTATSDVDDQHTHGLCPSDFSQAPMTEWEAEAVALADDLEIQRSPDRSEVAASTSPSRPTRGTGGFSNADQCPMGLDQARDRLAHRQPAHRGVEVTHTGTGWEPWLASLVATLVDAGHLHTKEWIEAFADTPRHGSTSRTTTRHNPTDIPIDDKGFRFLQQLQLQGARSLHRGGAFDPSTRSERNAVIVTDHGNSRAEAFTRPEPDGAHRVTQSGPRRIWDTVEATHRLFDDLVGRPTPDKFGVVANDSTQFVWFGDDDNWHRWPLPLV